VLTATLDQHPTAMVLVELKLPDGHDLGPSTIRSVWTRSISIHLPPSSPR
jgi:hypothetical protein